MSLVSLLVLGSAWTLQGVHALPETQANFDLDQVSGSHIISFICETKNITSLSLPFSLINDTFIFSVVKIFIGLLNTYYTLFSQSKQK